MRRCIALWASICLLFIVWGSPTAAANNVSSDGGSLLIVNKKANEMAYFQDGVLLRIFPVATGKTATLTPEGTFPIVNKMKNRPYYTDKIAGGDPANPLGDRWLGLHVGNTVGTTYAIHGNNNSNSIGKHVSKGCIRMHNEDIHWLFDQIKLNTKVVITSSDLSFDDLAAKHSYPIITPLIGTAQLNEGAISLDNQLVLYRDTTFITLRTSFELAHGIVVWDPATKQITSTVGSHQVIHLPGTAYLNVDGEPTAMTTASITWNGVVMVPLRDIASITGWTVHWDGVKKTIDIYENGASF